jgi:hypothetical protein
MRRLGILSGGDVVVATRRERRRSGAVDSVAARAVWGLRCFPVTVLSADFFATVSD